MDADPKTLELAQDAPRRSMQRLVRHLDLFSGIGGFALAAKMVGGIETVGFCEIDAKAAAVLRKNFPGIPVHDDVRTLKPQQYDPIDLLTGGYPCQPFSHAGKRLGEEDDRHLWPAMRTIIERARPRWVLCENVAGHVTMGLDTVLSELESIGYTARPLVIPACAVDARHRRDRVWILGNTDRPRRGQSNAPVERGATEQPYSNGQPHPHTIGQQCQRGCEGEDTGNAAIQGKSGRMGRERAWCEWEAEPAVGRVAHGIPGRVDRIKGLGNAIVPQVAAEILRAMMAVDCMSNGGAEAPPRKERE